MNSLLSFAQLTRLIVRHGNFRHSGYDFGLLKAEGLKDLRKFCPERKDENAMRPLWKKTMLQNLYVRALSGQLAYLRNSLRDQGGHLFVPAVNLAYVRNPKAASTALSLTMLLARYPGLERNDLSPEKINFLADVNLQRTVDAVGANATFFIVVRNPFARIVSVYREFFEQRTDHFIYEDYLFGILNRDLSFKDFVRRLSFIPDRVKDQHLRPQSDFLKYYASRHIHVEVMKLEKEDMIVSFLSRHGINMKTSHRTVLPFDYRAYYDKETLEIVYRLYSTDIARFDYLPVYRELAGFVHKPD